MQFWRHSWVVTVHGPRGVTGDRRKSEEGGVCAAQGLHQMQETTATYNQYY